MQIRLNIVFILMLAVTASASWAQQTCKSTIITATTSHLVGNADGTAADSKTKLMWKRCPEGFSYSSTTNSCGSPGTTTYTWTQALGRPGVANTAKFAGYDNWRMPNIKELQSIVEEQCYNPAVNKAIFPEISSLRNIWSNSPADPNLSGGAYYLDYYYGDILYALRTTTGLAGVRLVRDCIGTECNPQP